LAFGTLDEVHSGRGYQSHWGSRLHFGLGQRNRVDRIEVHWIGGGVDVLENVPVDQRVEIVEGSGRAFSLPSFRASQLSPSERAMTSQTR